MVEALELSRPAAAYAPRDVANAPELKGAIGQRSAQRGDGPEIAAWLQNHFYRYVIGRFDAPAPAVEKIGNLEQAENLFHPASLPPWVRRRFEHKFASGPALWWIAPASEALLALEARLVEFLNSRQGTSLAGKLARINCAQALALWAAEHAAFAARSAAGLRAHHPQAVRGLWQGRHGVFFEFLPDSPLLRAEMAYESQHMQHCLGQFADRRELTGGYGENYAQACEQGRLRLFSYRSGNAQPHITISAVVSADGQLDIDQIKGKQNRPPVERYHEDLLGFLNSLPCAHGTPEDARRIGIARLPQRWDFVSNISDAREQVQLAHHYPEVIRHYRQPTMLVQWLVAGRQPELLAGLEIAPTVRHALEGRA